MAENSTWICPEWNMKAVSDKGTPVCSKCDCDMQLKEDNDEDEEVEERSSYKLMNDFINEEKLRFEGESAIKSLNKITKQLGYNEESFRYGSSFERFIADNPGCCEKIVEWITEYMDKNSEWKENFKYEN